MNTKANLPEHNSNNQTENPSRNLKKSLNRLSEILPDNSPLISCFVDLSKPRLEILRTFDRQAEDMEKRLQGSRHADFRLAYREVRDYLSKYSNKLSRSLALYSRWGERPLFHSLEFQVPLETRLIIDSLPHLYPVIETKDTYHRFVIAIVTETEARIVETVLGEVTKEIFATRPELRERIGREWTREHYQNHKRDRSDRFINQKLGIIETLMQQRGHNHLIVAGSPKSVSRLLKALPHRIKDKLVTTLYSNPRAGIYPIVVEALECFAANEHIESHDHVAELEASVLSNGLAVLGSEASRKALMEGYADMLIIDQNLSDKELREDLVRLAVRNGVAIETVKDSPDLERLSGIGCLLRYNPNQCGESE